MQNEKLIGVKTTKIYCLPSCPAKSPAPEHVVYFNSVRQAERSGFRPCRRCYPDFPYGKWTEQGFSVFLNTPPEFDFYQCLRFLARSALEPCHLVEKQSLYKLLVFENEPVLFKIQCSNKHSLVIEFLTPRPKRSIRARIAKYVWDWFDLEIDLRPFYRMAKKDKVLKRVAENFFGLRILAIHDLFEAICWAIIGQQINLEFAYTLKKRLVESFGERFHCNDRVFYLFPAPQTISQQSVADLRRLQITGRKSEYIIELAQKIHSGALSKHALLYDNDFNAARNQLMHLRGVGTWTAEYVCLRCLKDPAAFPVDDIGLQNAIKQRLGLADRPPIDDVLRYATGWQNWQAYAAFYLWCSLI